MTITAYEVGSLIISGISVLVAGGGLYFVYCQLEAMVKSIKVAIENNKLALESNKNANLMTVLALEGLIAESRAELATALAQMALIIDEEKRTHVAGSEKTVAFSIAELRVKERKEQYLNALDRLCACIIRGYIDEKQYRQDYRGGIADAMRDHGELLGNNTRHLNIVTVHIAWSKDEFVYKAP